MQLILIAIIIAFVLALVDAVRGTHPSQGAWPLTSWAVVVLTAGFLIDQIA